MEGLTGSPEGIATLANRAETLLPPLLRLIPDTAPISRSALVALVNLAQEPAVLTRLLALNACARAMDYLREGACENPALLITLLANLTASEEGSRALLQLGEGTVEGLHVATLLKLFTEPVRRSGRFWLQAVRVCCVGGDCVCVMLVESLRVHPNKLTLCTPFYPPPHIPAHTRFWRARRTRASTWPRSCQT